MKHIIIVYYMFKATIPLRKNVSGKIFEIFEKYLFMITGNNKISGYIVVFFHYLFVMFLYLLLISQNMVYYIIGSIGWVLLILAHIFFNGCLFIRLERYLWKTNKWYGPWIILLKLFDSILRINKENTKNLLSYFYYIFTSYILFVIFRRGYYFIYEKPKEDEKDKDKDKDNANIIDESINKINDE